MAVRDIAYGRENERVAMEKSKRIKNGKGRREKREGSERTGNRMQESGQAYKNDSVVCLAPNFYWSVCRSQS